MTIKTKSPEHRSNGARANRTKHNDYIPNDDPCQVVLAALEGVRPAGNDKWLAKCPAHDDDKPSLTIAKGDDGRALLSCKAGCHTKDVVAAAGLVMKDLFASNGKPATSSGRGQIVAHYNYHDADADGHLLYQAVRFEPKDFRQRRPKPGGGWLWNMQGVTRVLYRLSELRQANPAYPVYVVEGEKDADNLAKLNLIATTNVGGAGKWLPEYSQELRGRKVVILPDNDDPGRKHADQVAASLQ